MTPMIFICRRALRVKISRRIRSFPRRSHARHPSPSVGPSRVLPETLTGGAARGRRRHNAALRSISLEQIWVIVLFAAGCGDRTASCGRESQVEFSLRSRAEALRF